MNNLTVLFSHTYTTKSIRCLSETHIELGVLRFHLLKLAASFQAPALDSVPAGLIFNVPAPSHSWWRWGAPGRGGGGVSGWKTKEQGYLLSTHHMPSSFVLPFLLLFHFYQEVSLTNPTLQVRKLRLGESL